MRGLPWHGNIRELRNILERAVILSQGSRLRLDLALAGHQDSSLDDENVVDSRAKTAEFLTDVEFRQTERRNLVAALECADWRVSGDGGAADLLGIKPSTLSYRMKTLGIEKPKSN